LNFFQLATESYQFIAVSQSVLLLRLIVVSPITTTSARLLLLLLFVVILRCLLLLILVGILVLGWSHLLLLVLLLRRLLAILHGHAGEAAHGEWVHHGHLLLAGLTHCHTSHREGTWSSHHINTSIHLWCILDMSIFSGAVSARHLILIGQMHLHHVLLAEEQTNLIIGSLAELL